MSKFKVGDEVVLVNAKEWVKDFGGKIGGIYEIVDFWDNDIGIQSLDGSGHKFYIYDYNIKLNEKPKYKNSNRYKLHKYILSTGFTKQDLSLALNKNQSYLTTETRESQFTNRGDMSDARYKSLRKQIKEAAQIKSEPVDISVVASEINQTLAEVEPKAKEYFHYDSSIGLTGGYGDGVCVIYDGEIIPARFAVAMDMKQKTLDEKVKEAKEALDTFTAPKPSNNGAFILGLVFFVMLIIFGIGCLIYKAA